MKYLRADNIMGAIFSLLFVAALIFAFTSMVKSEGRHVDPNPTEASPEGP